MTAGALSPLLSAILGGVLDAALKGAVLVVAAALATTALRRRSAALRHAVWTGALAAHLALPLLALVAPVWRVPLVAAPAWLASTGPQPAPAAAPDLADAAARAPAAPPARVEPVAGASAPRAARGEAALPASEPPARAATRLSPGRLLAGIWLAGALLVVLRLLAGTLGVWRLARRGTRVDDGRWLALAQRTAGRLGISRPTTLLKGGPLGVPVTWGVVYPVVLLPADADAWDAARRRYVLVHEMAHVRRFDALTQLLAQLAVALFWFNPLVWLAAARMRREREHACDDYVLREGTPASRYAGDLLAMVRALGSPTHRAVQPAFAALAMARRSEFEGRMLAILDAHHDRHPLTRRGTLMLAAALLVVAAPLAALRPVQQRATTLTTVVRHDDAPAVRIAAQTAGPDATTAAVDGRACDAATFDGRHQTTSTHIHSDDDGDPAGRELRYVVTTAGRCAEATLIGDVQFSADERDVIRVAPSARAVFRERRPGFDRTVRVTRGPDGSVARSTFVDGREAAYDAAAQAWLADFLPEVLREAGINAPERVARLRGRGGVPAVLGEIARIRSGSAKRAHYDALLDGGELRAADAERVAKQVPRDLTSSGDLSAVVGRLPTAALRTPAARNALGDAIGRIGSSGDRRTVLETLAPTADRETLLLLARAAQAIGSSGDKASFLTTTAAHYLRGNDEALRTAYFDAVATIGSSGDMRGVLEHAAPFGRAAPAVTGAILDAAQRIGSSGDKSALLVTLADDGLLTTPALRAAYVRVAETVGSGGDRSRALMALVRQ